MLQPSATEREPIATRICTSKPAAILEEEASTPSEFPNASLNVVP